VLIIDLLTRLPAGVGWCDVHPMVEYYPMGNAMSTTIFAQHGDAWPHNSYYTRSALQHAMISMTCIMSIIVAFDITSHIMLHLA
jgi:hypothetical protein